ncbi:hypothetical protein SARC_02692 [Sphaeroforma arctica JP610]|uniref:Uncharacterized protein n=1 Tax=Sphaeroforma arctica JP610 TaxID=667725 RepID=A0A0L0G7V6_9EUKA|nr:hypothetical protein SARC_02692 [Sphaeroforma arctica JP610]KNC85102.1 hypothetical protein SARC_02692 [Sphaeroforma arctica JP610]|eukprot:XP_014159004.1 hypothetical protein SARC_02692 [Sphaeroforma arctica JP610]
MYFISALILALRSEEVGLAVQAAEGLLHDPVLGNGYLSDPPCIRMYSPVGRDKDELTLYKYLWGTNSVESGVHQAVSRKFGCKIAQLKKRAAVHKSITENQRDVSSLHRELLSDTVSEEVTKASNLEYAQAHRLEEANPSIPDPGLTVSDIDVNFLPPLGQAHGTSQLPRPVATEKPVPGGIRTGMKGKSARHYMSVILTPDNNLAPDPVQTQPPMQTQQSQTIIPFSSQAPQLHYHPNI